MSDPVQIPEVLSNEDGEVWFVPGHLGEVEARLALLLHLLDPDNGYVMVRVEAYETALTAALRRPFMKYDPDDPSGEKMIECPMSDPGATAFTLMVPVDE